jgi:hypothetical protein
MPGAWRLENEDRLAAFTPSEPWPQGKRYELRLSASLSAINGMNMGKDFLNVFTTGLERDPPYLVNAWRITKTDEEIELIRDVLENFIENSGWEKDDRLLMVFSTDVDLLSAGMAVIVEGASLLTLDNEVLDYKSGLSNKVFFSFDKPPAFGSRFSIRLKSGVKDRHGNESVEEYLFRIFANGENSKPPSLTGIRLPMAPGGLPDDGEDLQLMAYGHDSLFADLPIMSANYPYSVKTETWIELYFDCAESAVINLFSLMELFRIETSNNVIVFTPLSVRSNDFSVLDKHSPWEDFQRIEIKGLLTNSVNSGLVHFIVNQGLKDNAGNSSEKQFKISLIK